MTRALAWLVLRLLPREFRTAHRAELERLLGESDALYGAARPSRLARARVTLAILADALRGAVALRAARWRPGRLLADGWQDARVALRVLRQSTGFAVTAILTIAIGIGAVSAMFTVINGVLLKPLPYPDGDRLVNIWVDFGVGNQSLPAVSIGDYDDYRRRTTSFEALTAGSGGEAVGATGVLTEGSAPERIAVSSAVPDFFAIFGSVPILGRTFTAAETAPGPPGNEQVVILSHALWARRFNADPSIVGRTIKLDGVDQRVVGVLPPFTLLLPAEAFLIRDAEIWKPLKLDIVHAPPRNFTSLTVFGRLRRGVTVAQAQADMDRLEQQLRAEHPEHVAGDMRIRVVPLKHDIVKGAEPTLVALQVAVAFVLLIACANVAHLLLARGSRRTREMAVRSALGATRVRLVRQLAAETLLIAAIGGVLGVWLASIAVPALIAVAPAGLPRPHSIAVDATVLGFSVAAAIVTGVLFGVLPALRVTRVDASVELKSGGRGATAMTAGRRLLIAGEVAMAVVLLIGTGLILRSFGRLQQVRPGFDRDGVTTISLALPRAKYRTNADRVRFLKEAESRLLSIGGVQAAGAISQLPLTGSGPLSPYAYDERTAANWESATADGRTATPGYFAALGTKLLEGRLFDDRDLEPNAAPAIVIDRFLAEHAWPGQRAVGKRLQIQNGGKPTDFAEVIGVVEQTRTLDLRRDVRGQIYRTFAAVNYGKVALVVRAAAGVDGRALAAAVTHIDHDLPLTVRPMSDLVDEHLSDQRFAALLMGLFAAIALALVSVGLYGVISYSVTQRAREIGIRLALGQTVAQARREILRDSLVLVGGAVVAGVLAAMPLARLADSLVYGVSIADPLAIGGACLIVTVVGLAGTLLPAAAITRVSPLTALRTE